MKLIPHLVRTRLRDRRFVIVSLLISLSLLSATGLALQPAGASGMSLRQRATRLLAQTTPGRAILANLFFIQTATSDGDAGEDTATANGTVGNNNIVTATTNNFTLSNALPLAPMLGNYTTTSVNLAQQTTVTPDAAPTGATTIVAMPSSGFNGTLAVDKTTGVVRITNASPVGTYTITVIATDATGTATKSFMLTVQNGTACGTVPLFTSAPNVTTVHSPLGTAVGDFNNDGKQDLATANGSNATASIQLGDGAGGFTVMPTVSTPTNPNAVAVGDFNGDGNQDIAVSSSNNAVAIRIGDGAGGFTGSTNITTGQTTKSIALGDFNNDGKLDFVTANIGGDNATVALGNGSGGFPTVSTVSVGDGPGQVVVADFNNDGNLDFATSNQIFNPPGGFGSPGTVTVRLGDGAGNFTNGPSYNVGDNPEYLAVGDFNEDGKPDLITSNQSSSSLSLILGDVSNTVTPPTPTTIATNSGPGEIRVADINRDGHQDVAFKRSGIENFAYLLGTGTGSFGTTVIVSATGAGGTKLAVGDFNGDGYQDFVTAFFGTSPAYADSKLVVRLGGCNVAPTITAGGPLTRQQASAGISDTIATVNDTETLKENLTVTVMSAPTGISVSSISTPNATTGVVTATVAAGCTAATGNNTVVLKVTDGNGTTTTADLIVNVTANTPPTLSYNTATVAAGTGTTVSPAAIPTDNGSIASYAVNSVTPSTAPATLTVNTSGVVNVPNNVPPGSYTVTIRATDNCGGAGGITDAMFTLTVTAPNLAVSKSHSGNFTQGQTGSWTIQVTNNGNASTSGTTTVSDVLPSGYTLASSSGTGWSCSGTTTVTCTSTQVVSGSGGNFNALTLTANVPANSSTSITNTAKVFGGGDPVHSNLATAASGSDTVTVQQVPASITANTGTTPQSTIVNTNFANALAVTVRDAANVVIPNATVSFMPPGSGASASLSAPTAMTNGSGIASVIATANTIAGSPYNVSATAGTVSTNFSLTNLPGAATTFVVNAPSSVTACTAFNFTVTARDAFGNTATGYTGTASFTSTDGAATLPANYTFMAGDNGMRTFSATLKTAGMRTITATDTVTNSITGTSSNITVNPGAVTSLVVSAPPTATLGSAFNFTVTAKDACNNTVTNYGGTVQFTSSDGVANLPVNSMLTSGVGTFSATLNTVGNQTITATDTVTPAIKGTSANILVALNGCPSTFTVNNTGDGIDINPGNGICETGAGNGICTLRAAIQEANALTSCSPLSINFNVMLPNTILLGSDLPTIAHPNLTITGPGANQLTVSGASMYRPFNIGSGNYAVTISGLTVANGRGNGGGGLINLSTGIVNLNNMTFDSNAITASSGGGGIRHVSGGTLNVTGSTFINNNSTGAGGGGINNFSSNGIVNVTNCTFSGNLANIGGGIHNQSAGTINVTNCTLVSNGGGINNNSGTVAVKNTIAVGNGTDINGTVTASNNLAGALASALLSALGNNGGTTQTFALLPGSPAINAGTSSGAPATDQRGVARPQQSSVDIGAFESRGFTLTVNGGNNQSTAANSAFTIPLSVTVTSSNSEPVNGGQVIFTPPGSGASAGLTTSPATISGGQASATATANSFTGSYNVNATAQGSTDVSFMLSNLCPTIMVSPSSLPGGTVGTNYNQVVMATGTLGAASFTVSAGAVPSGLTLSPSGVLSGTPDASGPFTFTVRATDTNAGTNTCFKERDYSITIACQAPMISDPTQQNVLQGGTATFTVTPSGTPAPTVQWQVSTDGGMNFTDIPMATGNTLTIPNVTAAMNGNRYRAIASNSCGTATSKSALLVVHAAGAKFDDPLVCLVGGDTGVITAFITNNGAAAVNASYSATNLAPNLIGIPGSGVASIAPANFIVTPTTATWTGVLQPGETVNLLFRVQFAPGLLNGAQVCFDATFVIDGNQAQQQICTILNCPAGGINPAVNAQKPASLLVFPYYTSKAATKADTRFTISNLGTNTAFVHVFFIDGASCQPTDQFLCLTAGASYAGKASETDGETTGWILALAVNQQGVPIQFNHLIGNAFVNDGDYVDTYAAEGFAARSPNVAAIQGATALLFFDGIGYDAVPNLFATEVQSPVNAPNQRVVTVGMRGDLNASALTGAAQVGTGLVINGNETPTGSFVGWLNGSCQAIATITNTSPRVPTGMNGMVPNGQNATLQFRIGAGVGLVMTPRPANWKGIRALHKIGLTTSTLRLPLIPPGC